MPKPVGKSVGKMVDNALRGQACNVHCDCNAFVNVVEVTC
jgi:hypothetical protein